MLTIISPAESHRLTTLAAVKAELQVTGGTDDAYLSGLIDQASDMVQTWCSRTFALERVRETIDRRTGSESIMLSRFPVATIITATLGGQVIDPADIETEDGGFVYRLDGTGSRTGWQSGRFIIEYDAGFVLPDQPAPTLPKDIERAALTLVKGEWFARNRDPLIRSEDVNGVSSTTYWVGGFGAGASLPPDVEGLLAKHRQVLIG